MIETLSILDMLIRSGAPGWVQIFVRELSISVVGVVPQQRGSPSSASSLRMEGNAYGVF